MTAAGKREELEAIVWRTRVVDQHAIIGILAAADAYADAVADDWLAKHVYDTIAGRERLAEAAAEAHRRTA